MFASVPRDTHIIRVGWSCQTISAVSQINFLHCVVAIFNQEEEEHTRSVIQEGKNTQFVHEEKKSWKQTNEKAVVITIVALHILPNRPNNFLYTNL